MLILGSNAVAEDSSHGSGHGYHKNTIGLFMGVTSQERREGSFTLGVDYTRRLNERFGIGVVAEHVFADHEFNIVVVPFSVFHGHWKFYAAPGVEKSKDHGNEFLMRFGVEYAFDMGSYENAPQVDIDFVDGHEVFVFGITLAKGF